MTPATLALAITLLAPHALPLATGYTLHSGNAVGAMVLHAATRWRT